MNDNLLFRLYGKSIIKRDMILNVFMSLSLIITISVSMIIPLVSDAQIQHIEENALLINGGELKVEANYNSDTFNEALETLELEGITYDKYNKSMAYIDISNDNSGLAVELLNGKYNISKNEVILSNSIAKNLKLEQGDIIKFNGDATEYKIRRIEKNNEAVSSQAELIGYAKLNNSNIKKVTDQSIFIIDGKSGSVLKEELKDEEKGYEFISLEEKKEELFKESDAQLKTLNVLNSFGYILTMALLISSIFTIIERSKKDISILKLLGFNNNDIKIMLIKQLILFISIPLIISIFVVPFGAEKLLNLQNISFNGVNFLSPIFKISTFNLVFFSIISILSLETINYIQALESLNQNKEEKQSFMPIVIKCILILVLSMYLYSILIKKPSIFSMSILILLFLCIIGVFVWTILTIISKINIKNNTILYFRRTIKESKWLMIILILNISMLFWFVLLGFNLSSVLRDSINSDIESNIPYNYMIHSEKTNELNSLLNSDNEIYGYNKVKYSEGIVSNEKVEENYVIVSEVDLDKYNLRFNILEGKDLDENNSSGFLISKKYKEQNNLDLGDDISILAENESIVGKIEGIYDSSLVNHNWILKPNENIFTKSVFLVKSKNDNILDKIDDAKIARMDTPAEAINLMVNKFMVVFKYLLLLYLLSIIIFNFNVNQLLYRKNEKNYAILRSVGYNNLFLSIDQLLKVAISVIISVICSFTLYTLTLKLALPVLFDVKFNLENNIIFIITYISIMIFTINYIIVIKNIIKKNKLILLREE